jgi:hypothetical protein
MDRPFSRRAFHDDEASAIQVTHDALRCDRGPEGVRVVFARASLEEPQGEGDRFGKVARIGGRELVVGVRRPHPRPGEKPCASGARPRGD